MPTRAVQFTILSIIALGYKSDGAFYRSEVSSILLPVSKNATIDKTLFYDILNRAIVFCRPLPSIFYSHLKIGYKRVQNSEPLANFAIYSENGRSDWRLYEKIYNRINDMD